MDIQLKHISPTEAELSVTLSAADYQPGLQKRLKDYSKKARIPGFRAGQVPPAHIARLYGRPLLLEEIQALVAQYINEYLKKTALKTLGEPLLTHADELGQPNEALDYHFTYQLGIHVVPTLTGIEQLCLPKYVVAPQEKDIAQFVEDLQYRFGKTLHLQQAAGSDILLCGQLQLDAGKQEELVLPRATMIAEQSTRFEGLAPGDTLDVELAALYTEAQRPAALRRLQKQGIHLETGYPFLLQRIDQIEKAPIDEALFEKVYGPAQVKDEKDFLTRNKDFLTKQYDAESRRFLYSEIKKRLVQDFGPPLPEAYLKKRFELNLPKDQAIDETTAAASFQRYKSELRWRMLQAHIAETDQLKVSPEALSAEVETLLLRQAKIYGTPTEEQRQAIQPFVQKFLSKKENIESLYLQMQEEQVLDSLTKKLRVEEKPISMHAFSELIDKQAAAA